VPCYKALLFDGGEFGAVVVIEGFKLIDIALGIGFVIRFVGGVGTERTRF
jgi:hypothetical protein